jgi:hypothetical protein
VQGLQRRAWSCSIYLRKGFPSARTRWSSTGYAATTSWTGRDDAAEEGESAHRRAAGSSEPRRAQERREREEENRKKFELSA